MEEAVGTGMGIVAGLIIAVVIGALVGWIASLIVKGSGSGFWMDVVIGIAGSLIANILLPMIGVGLSGAVGSFLAAIIGAVILLLVVRLIRR